MWSLPNIKGINKKAAEDAEKLFKAVKTGILDGIRIKCDWCDKLAEHIYPWYDIFSNDPKGIIGLCEEHDYYYGSPSEGYFCCSECDKVFIENYTWELYYKCTEDGEILCLNCYFDKEIKNKENWISSAKEITWEKVSVSKHLIPVSSSYWKKHIRFIGNVEFDNITGEKVTGFSSTSSRDDGLNKLKEFVDLALAENEQCILILDGTFQFAVSIGVYVRKSKEDILHYYGKPISSEAYTKNLN